MRGRTLASKTGIVASRTLLDTGGVKISALAAAVRAGYVSSVFTDVASQARASPCAGETAVVTTFAEGSTIVVVSAIAGTGT